MPFYTNINYRNLGIEEGKSQTMTHLGTIGNYSSQSVNVSSTLASLGIDATSLTINDFVFTASSVHLTNNYSSGVSVSGGCSVTGYPSFSYSNGSITCSHSYSNEQKYVKIWTVYNIYLK